MARRPRRHGRQAEEKTGAPYSRSRLQRVFHPNIAINPHALRVDRHGNIWATDSYWNLLWKLNAKGEVLMMLGRRGENGAWNDAAWNGLFNQPLDIAFDQDDNFYVVQGQPEWTA